MRGGFFRFRNQFGFLPLSGFIITPLPSRCPPSLEIVTSLHLFCLHIRVLAGCDCGHHCGDFVSLPIPWVLLVWLSVCHLGGVPVSTENMENMEKHGEAGFVRYC